MRKRWMSFCLFALVVGVPRMGAAYCCRVACSGPTAWVACSSDGTCPTGPCGISTSQALDPAGTCGEANSPTFMIDFSTCPDTEVGRCADQVDNDAWVAGNSGTDCADRDCCGDTSCPGSCETRLCAGAPQCAGPAAGATPAPAASHTGMTIAVALLALVGTIALFRGRRA